MPNISGRSAQVSRSHSDNSSNQTPRTKAIQNLLININSTQYKNRINYTLKGISIGKIDKITQLIQKNKGIPNHNKFYIVNSLSKDLLSYDHIKKITQAAPKLCKEIASNS